MPKFLITFWPASAVYGHFRGRILSNFVKPHVVRIASVFEPHRLAPTHVSRVLLFLHVLRLVLPYLPYLDHIPQRI